MGVICRLGLPADRAPLRCDQDRRDLHRGDAGRPRLLARGGATGDEVRPEDADIARVLMTACRDRAPARPREGGSHRAVGVRPWPAPDRPRRRRHADPVGQPRAVDLPRGEAGRDIGAVAERLQPRLVVRHRDRRHDPRLDLVSGNGTYVAAMIVLAVCRPRRARHRDSPTIQPSPGRSPRCRVFRRRRTRGRHNRLTGESPPGSDRGPSGVMRGGDRQHVGPLVQRDAPRAP